jgi:3-phenylpropionate/trans-cinnamate dioxygenase ferredoxin reductase subunit
VKDGQGGIVCDPFLQSSAKDIYAAGDVAAYPFWKTGEHIRVEHWVNAQEQGHAAA